LEDAENTSSIDLHTLHPPSLLREQYSLQLRQIILIDLFTCFFIGVNLIAIQTPLNIKKAPKGFLS